MSNQTRVILLTANGQQLIYDGVSTWQTNEEGEIDFSFGSTRVVSNLAFVVEDTDECRQ